MKVLRSGKDVYVAECDECGCVVSYGKSDVKYEGPQWDENSYLVCPECDSKIYLPTLTGDWMTRKEWKNEQNS